MIPRVQLVIASGVADCERYELRGSEHARVIRPRAKIPMDHAV